MIRTPTVNDVPAIAKLHIEVWNAAYRGIMPDKVLDALDVKARTKMWQQTIKEKKGYFFLAEIENQIAGFIFAMAGRDKDHNPEKTGEIAAINVSENYWGQGISDQLLTKGLNALSEQGFENALLWTLEQNPRARAFYEKHQFTLDGKREWNERLGIHEVRYIRTL